jgi:hypothetical protein
MDHPTVVQENLITTTLTNNFIFLHPSCGLSLSLSIYTLKRVRVNQNTLVIIDRKRSECIYEYYNK